MKSNRKCIACGTSYSFCPDCSRADALAPSWKSEFCGSDCMTLWTTATKYNMHMLTKNEAKEIIATINLKPETEYVNCLQRDLKVILAEEQKPKKAKRKVVENVVKQNDDEEKLTVPVVAEIKEITADHIMVEVEPVFSITKEHEGVNTKE